MRYLLLIAVLLTAQAGDAPDGKDVTNVAPAELGVELVKPRKDPKTGFVVGGKNDTATIRRLTSINGRPIAELERAMRPGKLSTKGFLGADEKLLDVLAADNEYVVGELGRTHQELARPLLIAAAVGKKKGEPEWVPFRLHGRRYRVKAIAFRGMVESPFEDGTRTNQEALVENRDTGKTLRYSVLVPRMVERYGFYEGRGTPYRVDPRAIVEVFDFLRRDKKTSGRQGI